MKTDGAQGAERERLGSSEVVVADAPIYRNLNTTLRVGVGVGLIPIVLGLTFALRGGRIARDTAFPGLGSVVAGVFHGDAVSLIFLGVVILLALPPLQAAVAAVSFWGRGSRRFALVAAGVLAIQAVALLVAWIK